jgi:hypothetical protein
MKSFFPKLFACGLMLTSYGLFADTIEGQTDVQQRDNKALQDWINAKRQVTVKEIGGALSISGEVRFEYQCINEKINGIAQRGIHGAVTKDGKPLPTNAFDVEVNLMFDYRTDRTWAAIKIEFDNDAGIYGGTAGKVRLEKAYLGGRIYESDTMDVDGELGRRALGNYLDSRLQFRSTSDGLLIRIEKGFEKAGDFFAKGSVFIIDERNNHFGYAGEVGMMEIASTGLYVKYNVIDWDAKRSIQVQPVNFDFLISEGIIGYRFVPSWYEKMTSFYAGYLYNHKAKKLFISNYEKQNMGGYAGVTIGQLRKMGDWSFDANYQILQAQCVPDFDMAGIGLGNSSDHGFYNTKLDGKGDAITSPKDAYGNGNFQGYMLSLDYQLTDAIIFQQMWMQSWTLDKNIGPDRKYMQYEIEFIYAF